jgi:hypothetical protein
MAALWEYEMVGFSHLRPPELDVPGDEPRSDRRTRERCLSLR